MNKYIVEFIGTFSWFLPLASPSFREMQQSPHRSRLARC